MDYKKKYELGSIVTATRKFNRETITGEFGGFHLLDKSNPKSIVGVVHTPNGSYDVEPNSIESVISEDERIRKSLLSHFSRYQEDTIFLNDITMGQIVAWLEKQGEHKLADKIEQKFKVGDWVVPNNGEPRVFRVEERGWPDSIISDSLGNQSVNTFTLDKQYRLWTIQDAKAGDVLADGYGIYIFEKFNECNKDCFVCNGAYQYSEKAYECEHMLCSTDVHPATKAERDLLFQKMEEAGYEWDAEKKELKRIEQEQPELPNGEDYGIDSLYHAERILEKTLGEVEGYQSDDGILEHKCAIEAVKRLYKQKPAWSEDDNELIDSVIELIDSGALDRGEKDYFIENLKSLKERYTWKPSDEQMKQLGWVAKQNKDNMIGKELMSLYQDLKKLKDE